MFAQIANRLKRMLALRSDVFVEIRDDERATLQAAIIVEITSVLWAIGIGNRTGLLLGLIVGPLILWLLWTSVAWLLGTRLLGGACTWLGLARVLGYAAAPFGLAVLSIAPCGGILVAPLSWVLAAILGFFGIREALDISSERALLTVFVSILVVPIAWALLTAMI